MYGYDAENTNYKPNATGPKEEVSLDWEDSITEGPAGSGRIPTSPGVPPAVIDGTVYVGTLNRGLVALDAETGDEIWSAGIGTGGAPAVMDGTVYASGGRFTENLYAVDAETGEVSKNFDVNLGSVDITTHDGMVYVGGESGVHAIDGDDLEKVWLSELGRGGYGIDAPVVSDGNIYFSRGGVYSVDSKTGEENWSLKPEGRSLYGQALVGRKLLVTDQDNLHAVDIDRQKIAWTVGTSLSSANNAGVYRNRVYSASKGELHSVDSASGEKVWSKDESTVGGSVAIVDGIVYTSGNTLKAHDAETGEEIWSHSTSGGIETFPGPPVVVDDSIYVGLISANVAKFS